MIDDEQSGLDTVEALLHMDRYELDFATRGQQALEKLAAASFDLILCDVMMPGMDGYEVCRQVKAHPSWRYIPLILLTVLDGTDDMVRGLEAGADEFLTKPVERVVLRARVRSMLRIRKQYTELHSHAMDVDGLMKNRREQLVRDAGLSEREREVLDLLLLGRTHDDIAMVLGISPRTSKHHQQSLLQKLGAESRLDLVRLFL
ncbi:MAG: response regulator [Polyangiaceae bacterium]